MKHLKLFFALFAMLALGVGNAWGAEVKYTFNTDAGIAELGVTKPAAGAGTDLDANKSYVLGDVSMKVTHASTKTRVYNSSGKLDLRIYKSGGTLTFSVPSGSISKVVFAGATTNVFTANIGTLSNSTWTGEAASVTFTATNTGKINTITVTYETSGGETPEPDPEDPETPGTGGDATMTAGTNGSACKVNGTDGIKVGSSSKGGNMQITVPAGATMLHVYAAAWNGVNGLSLNITPTSNVTTTSIALTADAGIANSTPFTLSGNEADYLFDIPLQNITAETTLTFTSSIAKRFVVWGATYETAGSGEPEPVIVKTLKSIEVTDMTTSFEQGDVFKFDGTCTATYSVTKDGAAQADETAEVTPTNVSTPDMNQIATQTVYVTYSEGGVEKTDDYEITITENTVTAGEYCITPNNEFWGTNFNGSLSGEALNQTYTGRQDDITIQYAKGSSQYMYINDSQTRVYGNNSLTFSVPSGYVITAIAFTADGTNWKGTHTANVGSMTDSKNWAGSANEVTITFGDNCRITKICVTYEAAPVEPVKTLTSIEITTLATQTTFWQGETFNYNGLVVTAHYSDAEDEIITPTVTGSTATAGTATVTVSFTEGSVTKSTSYEITVKAIPNTKETAYTVEEAYDIIDKLTTAEGVFIKGIVSQVDSYNETYKSITYWISDDGTTTKQLQAYSGKGLESADFSDKTDLSVGDQVIVCGNLKKFSGTYEFDKNNYLASFTPTTKDPAGLAFATTSYTANVGEPFTTPELTNPHNLDVTYSTSDASKATVVANTGAVTIVAAGVVTITAATTGDATHDAGSASYTITITDPSLAVATLPFYFNGKQADIEGTPGMTQSGIDSKDYAEAPYLKMNTTGDWLIICFDSEPEKLSYDIENNSFSGGTFSVQESADGETYTDVEVHTEITNTQNEEHTLLSTSRYVKFIYTEKVDGNVGLGNIKITKFGEEPEQPGEGGGEGTEQPLTDWVLTPLADITTNDLVVITMTKGETTWAMTNDNETSAPVASKVTVTANALAAEPVENLKWVVSNDNGTLTIYPYGGYETWLYCTNTNNGVKVGTGEAKEFTINTDHLYTTLTTEPRYLGVYDGANWRCYTSINSNIEDQTLAFYVKKNANDVLPGTGEDPEGGEGGEDPVVPTINPTATFIFNTAEGLNDLGIAYPTTEDEDNVGAYKTNLTDGASFTQDGITMTSTDGTTVTRVWLTTAGKLDLRVYKGATLTFSVPAEHKISAIVFDGSNIGHLLVNGTAVSGNAWTGSEQTVTFTAKADASTIKINTISFVVAYTRNVTNKFGTICLPYASTSTTGAYFYEVAGKEEGKVYLASVDALEAGVPYIFEATAGTITVTYQGEAVNAPQNDDANGLVGTFTEITVPNDAYILHNNAFCTNNDPSNPNKIKENRAYLNMNAVKGGAPQQMPGRKYIGMDVTGENEATGFENITNGENTTIKVIENGQLIIIRNGEKFNAQGIKL